MDKTKSFNLTMRLYFLQHCVLDNRLLRLLIVYTCTSYKDKNYRSNYNNNK